MPYIGQDARAELEPFIEPLAEALRVCDDGELNYTLSRLLHEWVGPNPNYERLGRAVMALECAKLEFARTQLGPYEDRKRFANGPLPVVQGSTDDSSGSAEARVPDGCCGGCADRCGTAASTDDAATE